MNPLFLRCLLLLSACALARAEVTRVEISQRSDVGTSGYEKLVGTVYFAVDPQHERNRVIADLDKAPINAANRVEFSADLYVLKPKAPAVSNGTALIEVSNRGGKGMLSSLNRGGARDPKTEADLGDAFLMRHGFTLAWVGWEFDVPKTPGLLRIDVPVATEQGRVITGSVRATFSVDALSNNFIVADLAAYPPVDEDGPDTVLTVRPSRTTGERTPVERARWHLRGNTLSLDGGFEPGKSYELSYRAANPPIAGLGFAAVRDFAAWLKHKADGVGRVQRTCAFGISQSGRFLRDFLYQGFNTDEQHRPVFDGVIAHIAGAARLDLNRRWSTPRDQGTYPVTGFPFADTTQTDPTTGAREGLFQNPRRAHSAKTFYTNTSVEYWGGGRVAALVHTDPAGKEDLALPEHVRCYAFAGTQHGPAAFPPAAPTNAQQRGNPVNFGWSMRALVLAMHAWIKDGAAPPTSAYPTFRDKSLVPAAQVNFPAIPGVASPRALQAGGRAPNPLLPQDSADTPLPLLVAQVDTDGNELGGIRLPEIAVPLGTYTGWNFRAPKAGAPHDLVALAGSFIPFPATTAAKDAAKDPRRAVEERYPSRADYVAKLEQAAAALVKQRYLLSEDVSALVQQTATRWDWATKDGNR